MKHARELYRDITRRKLWVRLDAGGLEVGPYDLIDGAFLAQLRAHKTELIQYLESPVYARAQLHTARQVVAGEFDGADTATREILIVSLSAISHPDAGRAVARLEAHGKKQHR